MFEDLFAMTTAIGMGPPPRIARDTIKGLVVSTVNSYDCGPETALLDKNGAHPVERYASRDQALKGHKRWVMFAQNYKKGQTVTKLGYGESWEDEEITLQSAIKRVSQNAPKQIKGAS